LRLTIIAALADNGVIGSEGKLPWHLPDDLRRFKALTMGRPMLMGRRTFDAIGRPLPGRRNLVLTRGSQPFPAGAQGVPSFESALAVCAGDPELCVIGGAEVYRLALPRTDRLELTRVHGLFEGDVTFPDFHAGQWREVARVEHSADDRHALAMTFLTLDRK
jgi:dihydrofolate reductase